MPLQLGLCGRPVRQGGICAARNLAIAAMMGWANTRYWRLKGIAPSMPFDAVLAALRTAGELNSDQFCTLVDAWRLLSTPVDQSNIDSHTNAVGTATSQLMWVILDWPRLGAKEVRKAKKRAIRRAGDALQAFHSDLDDPFAELFEEFKPAKAGEADPEAELEIGWPEAAAEGVSTQAAEVTA